MFRSSLPVLTCVAVLGAAGGVGKPLCMQLKRSPLITDLRLYDLVAAKGVAEDLNHMPTPGSVTGYGPGQLPAALSGADIVIITAGIPRSHGMSREDLFNTNALVVHELASEVAKYCPRAVVGILTNPLNSLTAVAAAAMERAGQYDPCKLFGLMSLNLARARTILARHRRPQSFDAFVPVVGGHSGMTFVPLFSQTGVEVDRDTAEVLTVRLRSLGDDVIRLLEGHGSSKLSVGFATAEWIERVARALNGEKGIVDYNLIESPLGAPHCRFFGSPHELGPNGVERVLPLPKLSEYEEQMLERCLPDLERNIRKGLEFHCTQNGRPPAG